MKFRFCGDGDCPDWVLAEIISTLAIFNAKKLESLANLVAKRIIGHEFEEAAIKSLTTDLIDDGKSAIACIHFLLVNAARHNASKTVFSEEIQQLGLPKDQAAAMCCVLETNITAIRQKLIDKSFKINEVTSVKHLPKTNVNDDNDATTTINCAQFEFKISQELVNGLPENTTHILNIDYANLQALLDEMKTARSLVQKYDLENKNKIEN